MKNLLTKMVTMLIISFCMVSLSAQGNMPSIAVLNIDSKDTQLSPEKLSSLTRIEVTKSGQFEVMDAYDIQYLFAKNKFDAEDCYGKICLIEAGNVLKVD